MTKFVFVHIPEWWAFFTAGVWAWIAINTFVMAWRGVTFKKELDESKKT